MTGRATVRGGPGARDGASDASHAYIPPASTASIPWHALTSADVVGRLATSRDGLSRTEAAARLAKHGRNVLAVAAPEAAWRILARQFASVVVWLLVAAVVFALFAGDEADALAVGVVLLLNVAIGFATELRARRAVEALRALDVPHATVVRDRVAADVDAATLVPGDVIRLEAGAAVPADARLLAGTELRMVEAALTGESLPVAKQAEPPVATDAPLAERATMVYKGTAVAAGSAHAVVVATGANTEVGRIGTLVGSVAEERTPLERRLDVLGRRLALVAIAVGAVVAMLDFMEGTSITQVLLIGIAVAVAAVPEGLPAVVTITMAVGVRRMARRHALIRRLPTVESLGSTTVVCTDKTGTLTLGEMTATTFWTADGAQWPERGQEITVTGRGYEPIGEFFSGQAPIRADDVPALRRALEIGALANRAGLVHGDDDAWKARGDPTEAALLVAAHKGGIDRDNLLREWPETAELPFSSERMVMATYHRVSGDRVVAFAKGAPGRMLERCDRVVTATGERPMDTAARETVLAANESLAARGLRVLALAAGPVAGTDDAHLHALAFVGLVGMVDPPAPGVQETIRDLRAAGIRTIMLTGDQRLTAKAIALMLGVTTEDEETLDGRDVEAMTDDALAERVAHAGAFSRVSPEAKLRIVGALRRSGEIVAMLGDGVNDAPALRRADVGVAMGRRGTDVAKEAAGVILADDRFPTIGVAVEEGRVIYANIRRFVFYLLSGNLAEIMVLVAAGLIGLPTPLRALQILWVNLVTDTFPALALAFEPADPGVMRQPPRDPRAPLLSRRMLATSTGYAILIAACTLGVFVWGLMGAEAVGTAAAGRRAVTLSFMTLALAQLVHLVNARHLPDEHGARPANRYAIMAVAITLVLQLAAIYVRPLAAVLDLMPLDGRDLGVVAALALVPLVAGMIVRRVERMRSR